MTTHIRLIDTTESSMIVTHSMLAIHLSIHAVGKLTVGVAMALKRGHCNGDVEDGLEAVQKADTEYAAFLESVAVEHLTNERG